MDKNEIHKLNHYFKTKFGNDDLKIQARPRKTGLGKVRRKGIWRVEVKLSMGFILSSLGPTCFLLVLSSFLSHLKQKIKHIKSLTNKRILL